jgi:hypothetical protein
VLVINRGKNMNESDKIYLSFAQSLDKVVDQIWLLKFPKAKKSDLLRLKVASGLQLQMIAVARSIIRLTQIAGKTNTQAVNENAQIIMSSTRVLTESCNKFYYLVVNPKSDEEFERRFAYYTLVGSRNFRNLAKNTAADALTINRANQIYEDRKQIFVKTNPDNWPPFAALDADLKKLVLKGKTTSDYIESDFNDAIGSRLNPTEKSHYQGLGNVATHSSSVLLFMHEEQDGNELSSQTQTACFTIFNASRHLALLALEIMRFFPEMKGRVSKNSIDELKLLARDVKNQNYLND